MLKRSVILIFAVLLLTAVSGFTINGHDCLNKQAAVKVDKQTEPCAKLQGNKMKCCREKHIDIKAKDARQNNSPLRWSKFFPIAFPASVFIL